VDPAVFNFQIQCCPTQYAAGQLAESWEFTKPNTLVFHLRQGIYWQNIAPANGREFVASDVVFHYDRLFGLGSGVNPAPYWGTVSTWQYLTSVTATDKYTAVFQWKTSNPELILETMQGIATSGANNIENPEAVQLWGNLNDWHHAIGTGPFILTDFVSGSSATLVKNPNYWGHDERYPQNKLPYVDQLNLLIITDNSTGLAALRTGKVDINPQVSLQDAQSTKQTNPNIVQVNVPAGTGYDVGPRNDVKPFNDVRVREALQLAIDLPTIAKTYYGGTCSPDPLTQTSVYEVGWGFPYKEWPQDLKDEYAYNPTKAKQLLADAGYPNGFNTNCVADSATDLALLQIVQSYFAVVGVNMTVKTMDSTSFATFVQANHKQDALEFRAGGILGISYEPTKQFSRFQTGDGANFLVVSDPVYDAAAAQALAATSIDDVKKASITANKEVAEQHFSISLLQPNLFDLYEPWLNGYNGQYCSVTTDDPAGAHMVGFYAARFWIDQGMKNSMAR